MILKTIRDEFGNRQARGMAFQDAPGCDDSTPLAEIVATGAAFYGPWFTCTDCGYVLLEWGNPESKVVKPEHRHDGDNGLHLCLKCFGERAKMARLAKTGNPVALKAIASQGGKKLSKAEQAQAEHKARVSALTAPYLQKRTTN